MKINKQLPNISKTPQAKSQIEQIFNSSLRQPRFQDSLKNLSNVSFIKNTQSEVKQDTYFASPLLNKTQLQEVDRQFRLRKNEVYSQMLSENPFKFNDSQEEIEQPRKVSSIHVNLFDLKDKEKLAQLLQETSEFSDKLSSHHAQQKPANVIVQRQEVIKLAQWLDFQMKIIVADSKLREDRMLILIEQVFNQSLKELVREISVDCVEKGVLLEKIWNQYVNFNSIVIQANQQEKINQEKDYLNELKQVHQTYQLSVQVYEEKIKSLEMQVQQVQYKLNEKVVDIDNLQQKHEYLIQQYQELKAENQELKNDYSIAMNDQEVLNQKCTILQQENQKILKQLNDKINQSLQKSKRSSYIFQDVENFDNCKYTSCDDLYSIMRINLNQECQTSNDNHTSQYVQTDYRYFKQVGVQCDQVADEPLPSAKLKITQNQNPEESRKFREELQALEDRVRMEIQVQNELRKQKQQTQKDNDAMKIKLANQEILITQLQKDIETLHQQIDNNQEKQQRQDSKQREVTTVSIDQRDSQMTLIPQQPIQKVPQKQENNLPEIKTQTQKKQVQQEPTVKKNPQPQPQPIQQPIKQSAGISSKVKSVDVKDQKKQVKITKNTQIIPRRQSQDSLQINNSQEIENNNTNEDFLNKALDELTKDGKSLKFPTGSNQRMSVVQQRRQSQQQNYLMIQQEKQQQLLLKLMRDKKENIYVDVALAFINQLQQDFRQDPDQLENTLTIQNSLKQIGFFYKEKLDSKYPLYAICYEYYMNQFGLKNVAEQKMTQFCQSLVSYQQNHRVRLFARFLQLYDNISNDDLEFYIQSLSLLDEHPQNLLYCNSSYDCVLIAQNKVKQHLQILNENGQQILGGLDQKVVRGETFYDLDEYYLSALEQFQFIRKIQKDNFNELFLAIDVDDDQKISIDEFTILYDLIEGQKNISKYKQLFLKECNNGDGLNFQQFGIFCMHQNLFTKYKQDSFFNQSEQQILQLKIQWGHQRKLITQRLRDSNNYTSYYQDLIRKLDEALKTSQNYAWSLWRIVDEQSKRLYINQDIYIIKEFQDICDKYEQLCSNN